MFPQLPSRAPDVQVDPDLRTSRASPIVKKEALGRTEDARFPQTASACIEASMKHVLLTAVKVPDLSLRKISNDGHSNEVKSCLMAMTGR
jgi:hypothetical protein